MLLLVLAILSSVVMGKPVLEELVRSKVEENLDQETSIKEVALCPNGTSYCEHVENYPYEAILTAIKATLSWSIPRVCGINPWMGRTMRTWKSLMSTTMLTRILNSTRMVLYLTKSWVDKPKRVDLEELDEYDDVNEDFELYEN